MDQIIQALYAILHWYIDVGYQNTPAYTILEDQLYHYLALKYLNPTELT